MVDAPHRGAVGSSRGDGRCTPLRGGLSAALACVVGAPDVDGAAGAGVQGHGARDMGRHIPGGSMLGFMSACAPVRAPTARSEEARTAGSIAGCSAGGADVAPIVRSGPRQQPLPSTPLGCGVPELQLGPGGGSSGALGVTSHAHDTCVIGTRSSGGIGGGASHACNESGGIRSIPCMRSSSSSGLDVSATPSVRAGGEQQAQAMRGSAAAEVTPTRTVPGATPAAWPPAVAHNAAVSGAHTHGNVGAPFAACAPACLSLAARGRRPERRAYAAVTTAASAAACGLMSSASGGVQPGTFSCAYDEEAAHARELMLRCVCERVRTYLY